ncbi:hypothetical protein G3N95_31545 [Paraburkholderia sp. Tr-20389]|uniref:hypothetical protein n=1 Tax=Paraburkholderia sp. Tr-20389 TaxID=2703903 RepID=UPI0019824C60|nr:hypothetical protein [Paraburkholderia sp. Tr-20389]MBN3757498.1 hypothetical protein [Paraburkholderia sp. Tr-20389]
MTTVEELLMSAVESKSEVVIIYNGGSHPGKPRPIIPIDIRENSVFAREPGLAREKTFHLNKISRVTHADGATAENVMVAPVVAPGILTCSTFDEYVVKLRSQYLERGWFVIHDAVEQRFGISRFLKNGAPRKKAAIQIAFVDRSKEVVFDIDTGEVAVREKPLTGRERPWRVDSELQPQGKSFARLQDAFAFLSKDIDSADPKAPVGK